MLIRRIARPMLAATFISRGVEALRSPKPAADAARPTLEGLGKLPDPVGAKIPTDAETVVRVTAAVQIGAGLLLTTGRLPRLSSTALALSVVPGSLGAHAFWAETEPARKAAERRAFLADVGLVGGLIIAAVDTEGRPSLGWRARRAARKAGEAVSGVLPSTNSNGALIDPELVDRLGDGLQSGLHSGAERGRELAALARERGSELADLARERGPEIADVAQRRGSEFADRASHLVDVARDRGPEFAALARDRGAELVEYTQDRSAELAATARKESKRAKKEVKRAQKELAKRTR